MKLTSLLFALTAVASVHSLKAPIEGYGVWEPEWEIEVSPGQMFRSNGTVEEVYSRLLENHPEWEEEYLKPELARLADKSSAALSRRTTSTKTDGSCADTGPVPIGRASRKASTTSDRSRVALGTDRGLATAAVLAAATMRRSGGVMIIADGADALQQCVVSIGWYYQIAGQAFHKTNWNVIVRGDSC
ncbi:hypothetical protein BJX65DRAFT_313240 [Aspergillus insuetus]